MTVCSTERREIGSPEQSQSGSLLVLTEKPVRLGFTARYTILRHYVILQILPHKRQWGLDE